MKITTTSIILFAITFLFLFPAKRMAAADFEYWSFAGGKAKWNNQQLFFHNANFFKKEIGWFLNHTQVTYDIGTDKSFFAGVGYKQEYVNFSTRWRKEYRPFLRLFYQKEWENWKMLDKNQWEFRFMDKDLINRYRNQIIFLYTKPQKLTPYYMTELFVNVAGGIDYNRQRNFIGTFVPVGSFEVNIFLVHQYDKAAKNDWQHKFMLGMGLSYVFKKSGLRLNSFKHE